MFLSDKKFIFGLTIFLIFAEFYYQKWLKDFFWSDMLMHFLGGILVAAIFISFLEKKPTLLYSFLGNKFIFLIIVVSFVALIGLFWEFYEYSVDYFFTANQISSLFNMTLADTLSDLFFDLLGGLAAGIIVRWKLRKDNRF